MPASTRVVLNRNSLSGSEPAPVSALRSRVDSTPMAAVSKRRPKFTQHEIEQQLEHAFLHLFSSISSNGASEIEQLGPILLNIHRSRQQDAYLKALNAFVAEKEKQIEAVCARNYQVGPSLEQWCSRSSLITALSLPRRTLSDQYLHCSK